jgi:hypothetical protein
LDPIAGDIAAKKVLHGLAAEVCLVEKTPVAVVVIVPAGIELPAEAATEPVVLKGLLDHHARFPAAGAGDRITLVQKLFRHTLLLSSFPLV